MFGSTEEKNILMEISTRARNSSDDRFGGSRQEALKAENNH